MLRLLASILSTGLLCLNANSQPRIDEQLLREGAELEKTGRYREAAALYTAALDAVERRLGPQDITTAQILAKIGTLCALQHDDAGAKRAFEQSLRITEEALGPEHIQVGFALQTVAMLTHKQGHYAAAEPLYRRALAILEAKLGPANSRTALLEASMAKLYLNQGRDTEAETLLEKAIPVLERTDDTEQTTLAVALNDLAEAYQRDGRLMRAAPLYARVWKMVRERPQSLNEDIRNGLRAYTQMLRGMKRKSEARGLELQLNALVPK